jgi:hypothetical protein
VRQALSDSGILTASAWEIADLHLARARGELDKEDGFAIGVALPKSGYLNVVVVAGGVVHDIELNGTTRESNWSSVPVLPGSSLTVSEGIELEQSTLSATFSTGVGTLTWQVEVEADRGPLLKFVHELWLYILGR